MMETKDVPITGRNAPLDMSAADFRAAGHHLVDRIADWLERLPDGPVMRDESPATIRDLLNAERTLPEGGSDADTLLADTAQLLFEHSLFNGHPRFFGYITSSPAPIGALGDLLASAVNQNVGAWRLSPVATEIEAQTIRWIAELIGFPAGGDGLLVSGGKMANFICFLAARAAKAADVRTTGSAGRRHRCTSTRRPKRTLGSRRRPTCSGSAPTRFAGFAVDAEQRMNVAALERQIVADRVDGAWPFLVVGTAGSVSTGVVDPLAEIAAVCRRHDVWFHVDGAYGALAARVPGAPESLQALSEADSVAVDPHKWLYAPLEAGCALVRRRGDLRRAFSYHPSYYHFDHEVTNYFDYGPQNSRGFRALKVWLALRQVGWSGYQQMIGDDMRLSRHLHTLVQQHPDFEALTQHLSITTFRYVPGDLRPSCRHPGDRTGPAAAEPGTTVAGRTKWTGVSVQRHGQWPLCVARLHRQLPHLAGGYRGAAPAAFAPWARGPWSLVLSAWSVPGPSS